MNLAITTGVPAPAANAPAQASPAQADLPGAAPAPAFAAGFAQWLDDVAAPVEAPAAAALPGDTKAAAPAQDDDQAAGQPAAPDPGVLAAMALPLMAPVAAALPMAADALQPGTRASVLQAGVAAARPATMAARSPVASSVASADALPDPAAPNLGGTPATVPVRAATDAGQPSPAAAADAPADIQPAPRLAAAERTVDQASQGSQASQSSQASQASAPVPASANTWGVAAPAANQAAMTPALALAGPPPAWRQTLHEALGERLRLQVGNNFEQAVIRLEPPDLGRIDIAIRHSGGTLEVALSATHGEVVRQLHSVSDNLRNDLAGRQYAEVTVSVSQAPRAQQAGQQGMAEQQGRQRQGGRPQDEPGPGLALAEANANTSSFSLNGRE